MPKINNNEYLKTYLAQGDSNTKGEQVLLTESLPYKVLQLLQNKNFEVTTQ